MIIAQDNIASMRPSNTETVAGFQSSKIIHLKRIEFSTIVSPTEATFEDSRILILTIKIVLIL